MGVVSPTQVNANDEITAASVNTPINQLAAVVNGSIDSNNLADNAVTTSKVVDDAITEAKLADGFAHASDGYILDTKTWTYSSATAFTVSGDVRDQFPVGTKLKLTQTSAKYFYVVSTSYSAPNTTVTITGGTDYTLANAAITSPKYSYMASPQGFPKTHAYTSTITAASGTFTSASATARFAMVGGNVLLWIDATVTTVGTGTGLIFTLPVTANASSGGIGSAREDATSGNMGFAKLASTTTGSVGRYDNGNIMSGGSGSVVRVAGVYTAA